MQEPQLDESKDVRGNVEEAVAETRAVLQRFEEVVAAMGEPDADFDTLLAEQGDLMEKIEHVNGWELDSRDRAGDGRAALPAARTRWCRRCPAASSAGSRCARCC